KVHGVLSNRYFVSQRLQAAISSFGPDLVLYIPWTSLTARTMIRAGTLARYARHAPIGVLALQPRANELVTRLVGRIHRPDLVLACGPGAQRQAEELRIPAARIPLGVDTGKFRPATSREIATLRDRAGIPREAFLVLHVGHLKESRNLAVLERLGRIPGVTCMLVTSTSTEVQRPVAARLEAAGVKLLPEYQQEVELAYRLADAYVFPVMAPHDAIELPLSVLEAAACNLTIVSTRYGGLPDLMRGAGRDDGVIWVNTGREAVEAMEGLSRRGGGPSPRTRDLVASYTWETVAAEVLSQAARLVGQGPGR
ncbi:MAG: glycosyltransferase, partial [Acidobacteriota bacterium]